MKFLSIPFFFCLALTSCDSSENVNSSVDTNTKSEEITDSKEELAPEVCNDLNSFVHDGWKIISQDKGDLNKDGIEDVAIVLQETNSKNIKESYGVTFDSNPRELIILFGKKKKGCFELSTSSKTFIVEHDNEGMEDPFESISISKGTLSIGFRIFYSMGSWTMGSYDYIWRFQDNEFKLIGANSSLHSRADGEAESLSVNFSTNKYSITSFNMFDEEVPEKVEWKKLTLKELKTFKTFEEPWSWTINSDLTF